MYTVTLPTWFCVTSSHITSLHMYMYIKKVRECGYKVVCTELHNTWYKLTVFIADGDSIEEGIKVWVKFMALDIVPHHVLVRPWWAAILGIGQYPLQGLGTTEISLLENKSRKGPNESFSNLIHAEKKMFIRKTNATHTSSKPKAFWFAAMHTATVYLSRFALIFSQRK